MTELHHLFQAIITIFSGIALWLATDENQKKRRIGAYIGLSAQPFWLLSSYQTNSWGIFIVTIVYILSFLRILFPHLFKTKTK